MDPSHIQNRWGRWTSNLPSDLLSTMNVEDEGSSPWGDVPSRSSSNPNLQKAAENDAPPKADAGSSSNTQETSPPNTSGTTKSTTSRSKPAKRYVAPQATRLEVVDDSLGPLGPLGDNAPTPQPEQPPAPPQKEQPMLRPSRPETAPSQSSMSRSIMDSVNLDDENDAPSAKPRYPPPVQPPTSSMPKRQSQPSVTVEQAAKPSFQITVGDPHKVGDLTSSHTVYQVRTKTTSKAYRTPEFNVSRRYRDFDWLYKQLHNNNPGLVVPPPPEKQTVGRFDANFVESRRAAMERMLNKIAAHPQLQHDSDLKLFLESESFNVDVKHKERKEPIVGESKGMLSAIGISSGSGAKFIEHDDWFHDRRIYLDALENQLKALLKVTDTVVAQRKGLAEACADLSSSLRSLATVELSPSLSGPLDSLADVQLRIRDLYDRQAQQDVLTLGIVIDEYIRLIGSIKTAFAQRQKSYHVWHSAESEMQKRRAAQDKLLRQGRSQQDRITAAQADVGDAERRVNEARLRFEDMGRLMRGELERFEKEKVEDFKSGVETFLESAIEAQKELIELWETYLMQLDAEEDGAPISQKHQTPAPAPAPAPAAQDRPVSEAESSTTAVTRSETDASGATLTAEQEE